MERYVYVCLASVYSRVSWEGEVVIVASVHGLAENNIMEDIICPLESYLSSKRFLRLSIQVLTQLRLKVG
tara:strand:+ start:48 stop:257 length:210 start_codon:yes stop_codon:yes gene_type:complete